MKQVKKKGKKNRKVNLEIMSGCHEPTVILQIEVYSL